jgi:hypothetical protein
LIVTVPLTEELVALAKEDALNLGKLKNSITEGEGNIIGFIGERIISEYTGATLFRTVNFDLLLGDFRVDVKSKRVKVRRPDYGDECSVAAFNITQECDFYAFTRVHDDLKTAWILGWISKEAYFSKARFLKKGDIDGDNNFVVKADCYNMYIRDLNALPKKENK